MTKLSKKDKIKEMEEERLIKLGGIVRILTSRGIISEATQKEKNNFLALKVLACDVALKGTCQKSSRTSFILYGKNIWYGTNHSSDRELCGDRCVRTRENMKEPICHYSAHSEKNALDHFLEEKNSPSDAPLKIYNYKFVSENDVLVPVPSNSFSCERCLPELLEYNIKTGIYRIFRGDNGIYSVNLEKLSKYKTSNIR